MLLRHNPAIVVAVTIVSVLIGLVAGHLWKPRPSAVPAVADGPLESTTSASSRFDALPGKPEARRVGALEGDRTDAKGLVTGVWVADESLKRAGSLGKVRAGRRY